MIGYEKNKLMQRNNLTKRAKSIKLEPSDERFKVMMSFVSGPNDRYPLAPKLKKGRNNCNFNLFGEKSSNSTDYAQ